MVRASERRFGEPWPLPLCEPWPELGATVAEPWSSQICELNRHAMTTSSSSVEEAQHEEEKGPMAKSRGEEERRRHGRGRP